MNETDIITVGDPLPKVAKVSAHDNRHVAVTWATGDREGQIDFLDLSPEIETYKVYRPLRKDAALFETVHVAAGGSSIAWGEDETIDMAATTLERLAQEAMTSVDFAAFMKRHNLTLDSVAAQLGISRRQAAYYSNRKSIPRYVALACRYLDYRLELPVAANAESLTTLEGRGHVPPGPHGSLVLFPFVESGHLDLDASSWKLAEMKYKLLHFVEPYPSVPSPRLPAQKATTRKKRDTNPAD